MIARLLSSLTNIISRQLGKWGDGGFGKALPSSMSKQNSNNLLQKEMSCSQSFEVRSADSYELSECSNTDSKCSQSLESVLMENEEISETIKELILEEKRRNFISKTEQFYEPVNLKRCHSASLIYHRRENLTLPFHLERILHSNRKCPNIATDDLLDAVYGAYFGFLIGDVVGAHVAFKLYNLPEIPAALLMNGGGTYNIGPGQGTDQTEILLSASYGLVEGAANYSSDIMARKYLEWLESKPFNLSAVFALSFIEIRKKKQADGGTYPEGLGEALRRNSEKNKAQESNLGLIRVLPLVVWSLNLSDREFHKLIKDELSLICPNQLVIETGIIYGLMLRLIIRTRDQELAFYEASKWVYSRGSDRLRELWRYVELEAEIQSRGNMGRLKTSFTYACIEINRKEVKFMESLLKTLVKGGDTDANSAIVMGLVGCVVGYNRIPSYFKQKLINFRMSQSCRPREDIYAPYHVLDLVPELLRVRPDHYVKEHSTAANSTIL